MCGIISDLEAGGIWLAAWEGVAVGITVLLVALAVKALDDLVDDTDTTRWETDGPRVVAYALLLLVGASGLATGPAVSLFLCAYALGMAPNLSERLPSGLPAWLESVGAVLVSFLLAGPLETAGSLVLLAGVQTFDDYRDVDLDRAEGRPNIALAVGRPMALLLSGVLLGAAILAGPAKGLSGLIVTHCLTARRGSAARPFVGLDRGVRGPSGSSGILRRFVWLALGVALTGGVSMPAALRLAPTGAETWLPALGSLVVATVAGAGLHIAYRRGLATGARRAAQRGEALAALLARAERLDAE